MQSAKAEPARVLRTPRAAGVAGILFALLLGTALVLVRIAIPVDADSAAHWLADEDHRNALKTALGLVPFAGVFFLWFMGAVRDYVGHGGEDRFFDTLLVGSGLLFVAMLFGLAVGVDGLTGGGGASPPTGEQQSWELGRRLSLSLLGDYAMRMAAVFTVSTTVIGHHLGLFPRWLKWLGAVAALVLMFVISSVPWSELVFPVWVLALSGYVLWASFRRPDRTTAAT
ncbi:hypothetical protein H1V43_06635 [Streptomyces sp. PSKA54]|uniref:DUF4386 family protein n=1 Tax=Streptomyces himalayensis subsp. aureolus TaxID=2758039 RepID=A0A7W2CXT7_9ACTN|nr:hypothetical protein [Streptomyces himalayensis]MBA4861063.1 hypothetical protein [Streptomyces himalayensis subsp. aureolus]